MADRKYLDPGGVTYLWRKIKALINGESGEKHTHEISDISGLQTALDSKISAATEAYTGSGTNIVLPDITIGQMKAFDITVNGQSGACAVLPETGQYIVLSVSPSAGTSGRSAVYGGVLSGGSKIGSSGSNSSDDYYQRQFVGFYLRIS